MKLVTVDQMRDLERRAEAAGISTATLMENAGLAVAQEVWMLLGTLEERRILVICGTGNNGGDGLVAARHLFEWGAQLAVYLLAPRPEDDPNYQELLEREIPISVATDDPDFETLEGLLEAADAIVDALLGTGRARPAEGDLAEVLRRIAATRERMVKPKIVAVDLPSGIDADTGKADPLAVRADLTVTLGHSKVGLYAGAAADYTGRIQEVEIGIPKDLSADLPLELLDRAWTKRALPRRPADANKGTFGRVLAVAGSRRYVGASVLAAAAAYRSGAGYVTLATPQTIYPLVAARLTEATYLPLSDANGSLAPAAADEVLADLSEGNTLLLGPGIGPDADEVVRRLLASEQLTNLRGVVVDGDALNALSRWPDWPAAVRGALVLTPHPGEMARLCDISVDEVQRDRMALATAKAQEWGVTVVLKGAGSVIAAADGRSWLAPFANPSLATAGSGDVLAGAIAGLIAQGTELGVAAAAGVYLHGMAGDAVRAELGPAGALAGDLLPEIARAIKSLVEPGSGGAPGGGLLGGGGGLFGGQGMGQGGLGGFGGLGGGGLGGLGGGMPGMGGGMPGMGQGGLGGIPGLGGLGGPGGLG